MTQDLEDAVSCLQQGGVIAYPTEYCFGLGCDPKSRFAVERILTIKQRGVEQGVILVASCIEQVEQYALLDGLVRLSEIRDTWPGPTTWLLPCNDSVPEWICGAHDSVALRLSAHETVSRLCERFGGAIVSTSANRHGQAELLSALDVEAEMGTEVDCIVDQPLGGAEQASQIRDAISGEIIR